MTIVEVASRLLRAGYVDNEADARLAAVKIILAVEDRDAVTTRSVTPDYQET